MVYLDEMIERLETARDINTETEEADENIDDVISDLTSLLRDVNDILTGFDEAISEHEEDLKVITSTDDASYNGGYIDALRAARGQLKAVFQHDRE